MTDDKKKDLVVVRIKPDIHKILGELGEFGETYGDIVARVTKHYASCPEAKKEQKKT